jgi:hypothetical protein
VAPARCRRSHLVRCRAVLSRWRRCEPNSTNPRTMEHAAASPTRVVCPGGRADTTRRGRRTHLMRGAADAAADFAAVRNQDLVEQLGGWRLFSSGLHRDKWESGGAQSAAAAGGSIEQRHASADVARQQETYRSSGGKSAAQAQPRHRQAGVQHSDRWTGAAKHNRVRGWLGLVHRQSQQWTRGPPSRKRAAPERPSEPQRHRTRR